MREIEVKLFNINVRVLEERLENAGAMLTFDGDVDAIYFDYPDFRLRKEGKTARIRRVGDKTEIVVKGRSQSAAMANREEIETLVGDFEKARLIYNRLGFVEMCRYRKHRRSYALGGMKFDIDKFRNFPLYLEVEAKTEADVKRGVRLVGLKMTDAYAKSIMAKLNELHIDPRDLGFELSERYHQWRKAK